MKAPGAISFLAAALIASICFGCAGRNYSTRFRDLARQPGFVSDPSLVDTNNLTLALTNATTGFTAFSECGELAGIRRGMTMSEVVRTWGKPHHIIAPCGIGPRLYYGQRVSLVFREDRLVLLGLWDWEVRSVLFDNGLQGSMTSDGVQRVLGPSDPTLPDDGFYDGQLRYKFDKTRMDFFFRAPPGASSPRAAERLSCLAVRLLGDGELRMWANQPAP